MAQVHLAVEASVHPVKAEVDRGGGVTQLHPYRAIALRVRAPTTDEWAIPDLPGWQTIALHPELAREVAAALLAAAEELEG